MPIYTYHCANCGADFEKLVRNGTAVTCPECEGKKLERRMSVPARCAAAAGKPSDFSSLGPPAGGGACCGGSCHSHRH